jgi:DNA-binding NarL/FixJ family response regulator
MTIRVLVADDQALVRAGFVALLDAQDGIAVVAEADTGTAALSAARELRPDVVLMDIRMPELDGLAATRAIAADPALAEVRVVVLTTLELDEYVFEAMRAGASGFLVKHTEPAELVRAVRVVADGEALLSPSVTRRLVSGGRRPHQTPVGAVYGAGGADLAGTRSDGAGRRGVDQRRNRRAAVHEPRHRPHM